MRVRGIKRDRERETKKGLEIKCVRWTKEEKGGLRNWERVTER